MSKSEEPQDAHQDEAAHEHGGLDDLHAKLDTSEVHEAAREGNVKELASILQADPPQAKLRDKYELTPLHWASDRGQAAAARLLLEQGQADVNAVEKRVFRRTPLHFAALSGSSETVRVLLDFHANVNSKDYRGWTPAHSAAYAGDQQVLVMLRDAGADLAALTKQDESLRQLADQNGQSHAVAFLAEL